MNIEVILAIVGFGLIILGLITFVAKRPRKDLNRTYFEAKWRELQKGLNKPESWSMAIIQADSLLDEALKKRRFKGKTMGERLVSAQRILSSNDSVWYAHKLRNKIVHEVDVELKKKDVQQALMGLRQALRDLGAMK